MYYIGVFVEQLGDDYVDCDYRVDVWCKWLICFLFILYWFG